MSGQAKQAPGQTQQQRNPGPIHDSTPRGSGGKPLLILGGVVLAGFLAWQAVTPGKTGAPGGLEKVQVKTDDDRPACLAFAPEKAKMLIPGPESRIQYFGPGNRDGECQPGTTGFVSAGFAAKLDYKW